MVSIMGASITPAAVPQVRDTVVIDGTTWELVRLMKRDPAGAVYKFEAEASKTEGA